MTYLIPINPDKDRNGDVGHSESTVPQAPYSLVQFMSETDRILRAAQPQHQQGQTRQPTGQPQKQLDEEGGDRQQPLPIDPPDPTKRKEKPIKQL